VFICRVPKLGRVEFENVVVCGAAQPWGPCAEEARCLPKFQLPTVADHDLFVVADVMFQRWTVNHYPERLQHLWYTIIYPSTTNLLALDALQFAMTGC
jgi:hypothetical protein